MEWNFAFDKQLLPEFKENNQIADFESIKYISINLIVIYQKSLKTS